MSSLPPHAPDGAVPLWRLAYGAQPRRESSQAGGATDVRVWAPRARAVGVTLFAAPPAGGAADSGRAGAAGRNVRLREVCEGVFEGTVDGLEPGGDYAFRLDGGAPLPDPVSRWQPQGVHGPSRVVDPAAFPWTDGNWRGLPLERLVFYEAHVGTFTADGSFAAMIARLDHLRDLGVTALELMPVAEFPGTRNWGYDGTHLYAPQSSYGGPEGLKRLVDACHARGLAVMLDVVYNHVGPEGNYLGRFGPYFSGRYHTPWGDALNFDDRDCDPVRRHFIDNALYWLTEYHVDGLRLDAVHQIYDFGARHLLAELSAAFHAQARRLGRLAWLIAESDLNDTRVIDPRELGGWALDAQWSDDLHHAQHALLTGARQGYFADYGRMEHLCKALERGFVLDGGWSRHRRRRHGNPSVAQPGRCFVVCTQNHDQIANASGGRRLGAVTDAEREKLAAALLLCAPNLPLLFMGQEFGARTPFHYFTSHGDAALARAVTEGRRQEMASLQDGAPFADPQAETTFTASRLDWDCIAEAPHAPLLRFHRDLLALRRAHPCLHNGDKAHTRAHGHEARRWLVLERADPAGGGEAVLACNYGPAPVAVPLPVSGPQWRRALWSGDPRFGGPAAQTNGPQQTHGPPITLDALHSGEINVGPWQAVLYLREGGA